MGAAQKEGGVSLLTPEQIKNTNVTDAIRLLVQDISFAEAHKATIKGIVGETTVQICRDEGYNLASKTAYKELRIILLLVMVKLLLVYKMLISLHL